MAYQLAAPLAAYPYQQYNDSDEVSSFFMATNNLCQSDYVDFFNTTDLAVYTESTISGPLLDWIAQGVYGMSRPIIPTGSASNLGPYNTIVYNSDPFNFIQTSGSVGYVALSDDLFKRCMTWNFYKGDGQNFSFTWLKKRVARWLVGVNGIPPIIDETYPISVKDIGNRTLQITITSSQLAVTVGAFANSFLPGTMLAGYFAIDGGEKYPINFTTAMAQSFQMVLAGGVLQVPFMYNFKVVVL